MADASKKPAKEKQEPPSALAALLADFDQRKAALVLSELTEREREVLQERAHGKTYKQIARDIPVNPDTGKPLSEQRIKAIMQQAKDRLGVDRPEDATTAFMYLKSLCGLPVYTESNLAQANAIIERIISDREIEEVIQLLRSPWVKQFSEDVRSNGPKARRAKYGRHAITIEFMHAVLYSALFIAVGLALGIGFNMVNSL